MKLLLFGKDGQVGQALQPALAALGEVVALGRAEADFERPGDLPQLVADIRPDAIINAAAYTAVDRAETDQDRARLVNTEAVAMLAEAARRQGAWLVHYSTDYVYDGTKRTPYVETDEARPLSVYGATKLAGDLAIMASGCKHLIFRVSWVYAMGHANFAATMLRLAKDRTTLNVVDDQIGAPTNAQMIAESTAHSLQRAVDALDIGPDLSGLYHLAPFGAVSRADYARFLVATALKQGARLALRPEAISGVPTKAYPLPAARPLSSRLDTTKLRMELGVFPNMWERDTAAFVAATLGASA